MVDLRRGELRPIAEVLVRRLRVGQFVDAAVDADRALVGQRALGGVADQYVGQREQRRRGQQKQAAVDQRETHPHRAPLGPHSADEQADRPHGDSSGGGGVFSDAVTGLGNGLDDSRLAEFGPQSADRDLDGVGERIRLLIPHVLEQLLGGHDPPLRGQEHFEHAELLVRQWETPISPVGHALGGVQDQVAVPEHRRVRGLGPPRERADPGDEYGKVEGFGQVVVRAQRQAVHQVLGGGGRGQQQDSALAPGGQQFGAHLVSVHPGQVSVEHNDVVVVDQRMFQTTCPIERNVHRHFRAAQADADRVRHLFVVFDDQHPHGRIPSTFQRTARRNGVLSSLSTGGFARVSF